MSWPSNAAPGSFAEGRTSDRANGGDEESTRATAAKSNSNDHARDPEAVRSPGSAGIADIGPASSSGQAGAGRAEELDGRKWGVIAAVGGSHVQGFRRL